MQKNYLLQLCFLFLSISFLNSCRQELTLYEEANIQRESKFFENAESKTRNIEGGSEWIKILKDENSKNQFVSKLKDVDGVPIWDKITIDKSPTISNKSNNENSEQRIIIPLTQDDIFMSSYIVASINADNEVTYLENIDNRKLYEIIHDKSISKEIRENIIANVIFINYKALGFKKFINIPGDLFSDIPLDSSKTTKTIKLVDERSNGKFSAKGSSSKMMELMCISYEADDPNCSCHGTITVTKCFYVYVGGGSSGGGDGDGGSDPGSGGGGGGGSGSGNTNNTPWYLMNPDIDIYEYNGNVRGIFKSLTDYGIILQKEHVDYLQPKTTLTSTIKNICLSNNTGYKSTFVYNMLEELSFAYPQPDHNILNSKLTNFYSKLFTLNPTTNWIEFFKLFYVNDINTSEFNSFFFNSDGSPNLNYESWLIKKTEGQDGEFINNIDDILNSFQYQSKQMPTYSDFVNAFPKLDYPNYPGYYKQMPASQVYSIVGDPLKSLYISRGGDNGAYRNACTVRWSLAMNRLGILIPNNAESLRGADVNGQPRYYYFRAVTANDAMSKIFGEPNPTHVLTGAAANNSKTVMNFLKGKTGIYVIVNADPNKAKYTGHVDLIQNGWIPGGSNHENVPGGIKSIKIWEFKP